MDPRNFSAYGAELQDKLDSYRGSGLSTGIMGEVLARYENHVSIDKTVVDAWDIPVLHIDTQYTDNEFNMARDAVDTGVRVSRGRRLRSAHQKLRPQPARLQHPRTRHLPHGRRPQDQRSE